MEEIDIKEILNYFWDKKIIIIILLILSIGCGVVYNNFFKVPMYQSSTTIALTRTNDGSDNNDSAISERDISFNKQLINTYSSIIKSRRVLDQVIKNLKLKTTSAELMNRISVSNEVDTALLKIAVSDTKKKTAQKITKEILKVFSKEIVNIYDINNITILDEATIPSSPYNINPKKDYVIFAGIGLILGIVIIFIIYYFDTTVKSAEQIESKINIPVLAIIPIAEKKAKPKKKLINIKINVRKKKVKKHAK